MKSVFTGPVYVVGDNIDTDQIIPAQFLTLVPTIPEEYEKLGSYALYGLPDSLYPKRYVEEGKLELPLLQYLPDLLIVGSGGEVSAGFRVPPGTRQRRAVLRLQETDQNHLTHDVSFQNW